MSYDHPEDEPLPGAGIHVLVVDDDPSTRFILKSLIGTILGFSVRIVGSVVEARAALAERTPDVVLIDLMMEPESGLDLLREAVADRWPWRFAICTAADEWGQVVAEARAICPDCPILFKGQGLPLDRILQALLPPVAAG